MLYCPVAVDASFLIGKDVSSFSGGERDGGVRQMLPNGVAVIRPVSPARPLVSRAVLSPGSASDDESSTKEGLTARGGESEGGGRRQPRRCESQGLPARPFSRFFLFRKRGHRLLG